MRLYDLPGVESFQTNRYTLQSRGTYLQCKLLEPQTSYYLNFDLVRSLDGVIQSCSPGRTEEEKRVDFGREEEKENRGCFGRDKCKEHQ